MQKRDVYNHTCFKDFLAAYANYARANYRAWSYTKWAKRLGLKGTASLTLVISGKRLPGPLMTEKFIQYFKFDNRERRYFLDLIQLERMTRKQTPENQIAQEQTRLNMERELAQQIQPMLVPIHRHRLQEVFEFLNQMQNEFIRRFAETKSEHMFLLNVDLEPALTAAVHED